MGMKKACSEEGKETSPLGLVGTRAGQSNQQVGASSPKGLKEPLPEEPAFDSVSSRVRK